MEEDTVKLTKLISLWACTLWPCSAVTQALWPHSHRHSVFTFLPFPGFPPCSSAIRSLLFLIKTWANGWLQTRHVWLSRTYRCRPAELEHWTRLNVWTHPTDFLPWAVFPSLHIYQFSEVYELVSESVSALKLASGFRNCCRWPGRWADEQVGLSPSLKEDLESTGQRIKHENLYNQA